MRDLLLPVPMTIRAQYMSLAMFVLATLGVACASTDKTSRVDPIGPSFEQFKSVAPMLVRRCGSIDCHGSVFRNFRLYGYGGRRFDPSTRPDFPPIIEPSEVQANYDAFIGLEPEIMRDVVQSGGADPGRLTIVRKARNEEDHKGGLRITRGDDADKCLLTWLQNKVDTAACERAGCVADGGTIQTQSCVP